MDLELHPKSGAPVIEGYGDGYVKVSGTRITNNFILFPEKYDEVKSDYINSIIKSLKSYKPNIDLVIYGGNNKSGPDEIILDKLKILSIPIEYMFTFSACRTWSVLVAEGRSVSAIIEPYKYKK